MPPATPHAPFAALVVATGLTRDAARAQLVDDHLDRLVATLALMGGDPILVVHDGTPRVPSPARDFLLPRPEGDDLSALRLGLAQLANTPVGAALVVPIESHATEPLLLRRMLEEPYRRQLPLAAAARHGELGLPLYAERDSWRDILTSEGGLAAVLRRHGPRVVAIELE